MAPPTHEGVRLTDPLALNIPTLTEPAPPFLATTRRVAVNNGSGPAHRSPALSADATSSVSGTISHTAARGYNQLIFEGRLAENPMLRQAGTGRLYCCVAILQDQPDRNGQPGVQAVDVVCFDERAARFAERFRRGDYAIFIGRITIERRRDKHGQSHMNVSLHLERVLGHRPTRR